MAQTNTLIEHFKQKIESFGISKLESELLSILLINGTLKVSDIRKKLSRHSASKDPQIYSVLKNLSDKGWLVRNKKDVIYYSLIDKKTFQKLLDKKIEKTQQILKNQKDYYYELNELVKSITINKIGSQISSNLSDLTPKISAKVPEFLQKWIVAFLKEQKWGLFKTEGNLIIKFPNEMISFKLHSIEFEIPSISDNHFGGASICQMESAELQNELLPRIHIYNVGALRFSYKMERKGYVDEKKVRGLRSAFIGEVEEESARNSLSSEISLETQSGNLLGKIESVPLALDYIATIWAEDEKTWGIIYNSLKKVSFT